MLKVRIAEMERNIAKQFGVDLAGRRDRRRLMPLAVSTANQFGLVGQALSDLSGAQVGQVCNAASAPRNNPLERARPAAAPATSSNNVQGAAQGAGAVGLVHMLAEPNLTAVSRRDRQVPGRRRIPGAGQPRPRRQRHGRVQAVRRRPVLHAGRAERRPHLAADFHRSQRTHQHRRLHPARAAPRQQRPASPFRRCRCAAPQTTVELPSGGSFAIAGLMQHNTKQVIDGFPGVKDLPVLGALFRSRDFARTTRPNWSCWSAPIWSSRPPEARFAAPTDGFVAPTDPETILLGRLNAVYKRKDDKPLTPQAVGARRLHRALGGRHDTRNSCFRAAALAAVLIGGQLRRADQRRRQHRRGRRRQSSDHGRAELSRR